MGVHITHSEMAVRWTHVTVPWHCPSVSNDFAVPGYVLPNDEVGSASTPKGARAYHHA